MASMNPRVSVIVPVYNGGELFRETLDSLIDIESADAEFIIVDDGSSDNTKALIEAARIKDARIRYVYQENSGAGPARNNGLSKARGEYLLFLDSDDLFERNIVEKMLERALETRADIVICGSDSFESATGEHLGSLTTFERVPVGSYTRTELDWQLYQIVAGRPWDKLIRRGLVEGLQFQALHHSNDTYFIYVALARSSKIAFMDDVLVHYRVASGGSLRDNTLKDPMCDFTAMDAVFSALANTWPQRVNLMNSFKKQCTSLLVSELFRFMRASEVVGTQVYDALFHRYLPKWGIPTGDMRYFVSWGMWLKSNCARRAGASGVAWACAGDNRGRVSRGGKVAKLRFAARLVFAGAVGGLVF